MLLARLSGSNALDWEGPLEPLKGVQRFRLLSQERISSPLTPFPTRLTAASAAMLPLSFTTGLFGFLLLVTPQLTSAAIIQGPTGVEYARRFAASPGLPGANCYYECEFTCLFRSLGSAD